MNETEDENLDGTEMNKTGNEFNGQTEVVEFRKWRKRKTFKSDSWKRFK